MDFFELTLACIVKKLIETGNIKVLYDGGFSIEEEYKSFYEPPVSYEDTEASLFEFLQRHTMNAYPEKMDIYDVARLAIMTAIKNTLEKGDNCDLHLVHFAFSLATKLDPKTDKTRQIDWALFLNSIETKQ